MKSFVLILWTVLMLHASDSYILLTANVEDIHAMAKQLAVSPAVDRVKKIWRRASIQAQKELTPEARKQFDGIVDKDRSADALTDRLTRRITTDLVALAKESGYLEPINQILQKI